MSQPNANLGFYPDGPSRASMDSRGPLDPPPWPEMLRRMEAVGALDAPRCGRLPLSVCANDGSYRQVLSAPRRARRRDLFVIRLTQLFIVVLCCAFWGEVITLGPRLITHAAEQTPQVMTQLTAGLSAQRAAPDRWAAILTGPPAERVPTAGMATSTGVRRG